MPPGGNRRAPRPPGRERLSREALVASAMQLADAEGLDAVTIRRLATDHGVTPMALYWHFGDKSLLMEAVAERVLEQVEIPSYADGEPPEWDVRLAELFSAMVVSLSKHPALAPLVHRRLMRCTPGLAIGEVCFAALDEAGFSQEEFPFLGTHAMNSIIGLVTMQPFDSERTLEPDDSRRRDEENRLRLELLALDRFPHVRASAALLASVPANGRGWYESGIGVLVSGIRALRQPAAPPAT